MRDRRLTTLGALLVALMLTAIAPLTTSAATGTRFGAKLTKDDAADPPRVVPRQQPLGHLHLGRRRGVRERRQGEGAAERHHPQGPAHLLRRGQLHGPGGTRQAGEDKAKIVRSGPTINYAKDTQSGGCGGPDEDNYKIQSFSVNFHVNEGDYIAVKGNKVGFIHNSSSGDALKFRPTLPVGGSYEVADDDTGSLLIQFEYAS